VSETVKLSLMTESSASHFFIPSAKVSPKAVINHRLLQSLHTDTDILLSNKPHSVRYRPFPFIFHNHPKSVGNVCALKKSVVK